MSETETERPDNVDENGELVEPESDDDQADDAETSDDPGEEQAEAAAENEREQELAAARQEEAASLEKQQRDQDARAKKLNQLAAHTAKRYQDILGPDLDGFVGCPMCEPWFPGIRLPMMPEPETVAKIKAAIGEDPDPPLHDDPYSRQCDSCGGFGVTKTNSFVTGQKSATCLDCHGRGWIAVGNEREQPQPVQANGAHLLDVPQVLQPAPPPLQVDEPRTQEEERLRAMGAIVVWPPKPPDPIPMPGVS